MTDRDKAEHAQRQSWDEQDARELRERCGDSPALSGPSPTPTPCLLRVGDRYTLRSQRGNPFAVASEIKALKDGWVYYLFDSWASSKTSLSAEAFALVYEPTDATREAQRRGLSLPDWLAYEADQRQMAEDDANEQVQRDWEQGIRAANEEAEREAKL